VPDGSRHEWLAGFDAMDLIVTMDDATSVMVHTLPDRLVKELALAGITTVEAANGFIRTVFTTVRVC
jgi:hypothetical protein